MPYDPYERAAAALMTDRPDVLLDAIPTRAANIARGLKAMQRCLETKADQHRAMYREGLGWIDFVWGEEDGHRSRPGSKARRAKGIAHVIEARTTKDGYSRAGLRDLLSRVVTAIADGVEVDASQAGDKQRSVLQDGSTKAVLLKRPGGSAWVLTSFDVMATTKFRELKDGGTKFFEGVAGGATRMVGSMHALQAAAPTAAAVAPALTARAAVTSEDGGLSLDDGSILRQSVALDNALADTDAGIVTAFDLFEGVGDASKAGSVTNTPTQAPGFPARQGVVAPTLTARVQSHHKDGGLSLSGARILRQSAALDNVFAAIESAAHEAATGHNDTPEPTAAQKRVGNYRLGRVVLHDMRIGIENPRGTYREGVGEGGKPWRNRMAAHYGSFTGTRGADGDGIDVFIGPFPEVEQVYLINQKRRDGGFDEHKVVLGANGPAMARQLYLDSYEPGWDRIMTMVPLTLSQLRWWLKFGDHLRPLTLDQLPPSEQPMKHFDKVLWDGNLEPIGQSLARVVYNLRAHDGAQGLLLDAVTMDELLADPDIESLLTFDAMVVETGLLQKRMDALQRIMGATGTAVTPTGLVIGDPVKARGVLQVPVLFTLSDGQTVTVWFHNPDTTPNKLTPMDELVSWKWMLNKKDITVAVAPERGTDLNPREVARRVMKLAEKNSPAFQRANEKLAERVSAIESIKGEILGLEGELAGLKRRIEVAQVEREGAASVRPAVAPTARAPIAIEPSQVTTGQSDLTGSLGAVESGAVGSSGDQPAGASGVVRAKPDAILFIKGAVEKTLQSTGGRVTTGDKLTWALSTASLNKMVAATNKDGAKAHQRERIIAIQSISELAAAAHSPTIRTDDGRDRDVEAVYEYFVPFEVDGEKFRVRLLCKKFVPRAALDDKMHSLAMDEVPANQDEPDGVLISLEILGDVVTRGTPDRALPPSANSETSVAQDSRAVDEDAKTASAPATPSAIPPRIQSQLDALLRGGQRLQDALVQARVTDEKFNGGGRYAAEVWSNLDGDKVLADEADSIARVLQKIPAGPNRDLAAAYFDANRARPALTENEAGAFAPAVAPAVTTPPPSSPSEVDPNEISTDISAWKEPGDESLSDAVERFVSKNLQGRYIQTVIGRVLFNAVSKSELQLGTAVNELRAALIPFVPFTLKNGEYQGRVLLNKKRKDKFVAFHKFSGEVKTAGFKVNHIVSVGERETGDFVFIAYHSKSEGAEHITRDSVSNYEVGRSQGMAAPSDDIVSTLDGVVKADDYDGWNINIVAVWDKDGNRVKALEDGLESEAVEPVATVFTPSPAWKRMSATEYRISDPDGLSDMQIEKKGKFWLDPDSGMKWSTLVEAQQGVEGEIAARQRTKAEEAASRAELEAQSPAADPAPALNTVLQSFPVGNGMEWRVVVVKNGHAVSLYDTDAEFVVEARIFPGEGSLQKATEYAKRQADAAVAADRAPDAADATKKIRELFQTAVSRKDGNKNFLDIGEVTEDVSARITAETGLNVAGYQHSIDESSIRHILKQHGDPASEAARGQVAITEDDIASIPHIVASPDTVTRGEKTSDGKESVVFKKKIGDDYVYVQEVREGRKKLSAKTLWKVRIVPPAATDVGEAHTSETPDRDASTEATSVSGPDVFGNTQAAAEGLTPEGATNEVKTPKGTQVTTGFTVVEADRLITSNDPQTGEANPEYPAELQPRDRKRESSRAWVIKTSQSLDPGMLGKTSRADSGAPIIGRDRVVESGNGRCMAIVLAYRTGNADEYRTWVEDNAASFGLSPARVKAMKRPVLVRVRTSEVDRKAFTVEANQDDKLAMTATEKARSDAGRLDDDMIALMTDNGDLTAAGNLPFLAAFMKSLGDAEAAQYATSQGKPTASLIARVQAAIFAKAYDDDRLLELTADAAKPEIANIISALNFAAPEFIQAAALDPQATGNATQKLADSVQTSLNLNAQAVQAILGATEVLRQSREADMTVEEFVKQQGLFGDIEPAVAAMAVFIAQNNRSGKRLGAAFKAMATFVKAEALRAQTEDMFGTPEPVGFADIVAAANRELERQFGEGAQTIGLFDRPAEVAPDPVAEPAPEPDLVAQVDAAYRFADATDDFKRAVHGSMADEAYSEFLTAKRMDEAAQREGGSITWDVRPDVEMDAVDAVGSAWGEWALDDVILDGDHKGHPFRGNQHVAAHESSGHASSTSRSAKYAERTSSSAMEVQRKHHAAYKAHAAAIDNAKIGSKAFAYHSTMASFHKGRVNDLRETAAEESHQQWRESEEGKSAMRELKARSKALHEASAAPGLQDGQVDSKDAVPEARPARFAKGKVAVVSGGRAARMAEDFGGRYSRREQAFIMSPAGHKKLMEHWTATGKAVKENRRKEHERLQADASILDGIGDYLDYEFGSFPMILDQVSESVLFDEVDSADNDTPEGTIEGLIRKDGQVRGRAVIGGDGKAMVYLGATGTQRVVFPSGTAAMWSDDDAAEMVRTVLSDGSGGSDAKKAWRTKPETDPAGGTQAIESWDNKKAASLYGAIAVDDPRQTAAVKKIITEYMQGRIIKTRIGDCIINSASRGKLVDNGSRINSLKLQAIAHVPEILIYGEPGNAVPIENPSKQLSRTSSESLIPFTHTFEVFDGKRLRAMVKVGSRVGAPHFVYSLTEVTLDSAKEIAFELLPAPALFSQPAFAGSLKGDTMMVLDDSGVVNTEVDGLNIEILQAWDADGNELDPNTGERLKPSEPTTPAPEQRPESGRGTARDITDALSIAQQIGEQLGGSRFKAMTGASKFVSLQAGPGTLGGLQFSLPMGFSQKDGKKTGITRVLIRLNANDLYDIEFGAARGTAYRVVATVGDVQADALQRVFSEYTGLDTSLGGDALKIGRMVNSSAPTQPTQAEPAASVATPATAPTPEPGNAEDRALLTRMIDGSADYFDPTLFDKVELMIAKYESDPEMMALIDKAAVAYSEAADRLTA